MKRLEIIGLALLVLFVTGAAIANTAVAAEGVLPLNTKGFTILAKHVFYETHAKERWFCGMASGSGKLETDSHGTAVFDFDECEFGGGFIAFSLGEKEPKTVKEGLILIPVSFSICLINSAELRFGLFIELTEAVHVHIKALGILLELTGSFIGELLTQEGKLFVVDFLGKEGLGNVSECKDEAGGAKKAVFLERRDPNSPVEESVNFEGGLLQFEEVQKLMDT